LVVVKKADSELGAQDILSFFDGKVATWRVPAACEFVEALPHTTTGKLDKKVIREQFQTY